jgi:tripartite-type tricarboxylate transporter receptor subunit TctC
MAANVRYDALFASLMAAILIATSTARAQSGQRDDEFYSGKTIRIIVTTAAGGGYDLITRTTARYLPRYVSGSPTVIVENMPGAGSLKGTNYLYNVTPSDDAVIGQIGNQVAFAPLLRVPQVHFDPMKFHWLGSPTSDVGLLIVWHTVPVDTIADAEKREVLMATSGGGSTSTFYARVLNSTLGTKLKILTGYNGTNDAYLAMERGEVDGFPSVFWSSLKATKPDWIRDKKVKYLVQYGSRSADPELRDVPAADDLAKTADDKRLLDMATAPLELGTPFVMPPGVASNHVETMRNALMSVFTDNGFVADARKQGFEVKAPKTGKQLEDIVRTTYNAPQRIIDRLVALSAAGGSETK